MSKHRAPRTPFEVLESETTDHQLVVLKDEGLYRHLRFKAPDTMMWHFDLVTWPGHLVVTGDIEDFHFARLADMFEFFRNRPGDINPGYWAEKLRGPVRHKRYSEDLLRRQVYQAFRWGTENRRGPNRTLWQAICEEVLSPDVAACEDTARMALRDFRFEYPESNSEPKPEIQPERDFQPQLIPKRQVSQRSRRSIRRSNTFEFDDWWEWDLTDFDWHFLVSLHAIVWGINQYDKARAAIGDESLPVGETFGGVKTAAVTGGVL